MQPLSRTCYRPGGHSAHSCVLSVLLGGWEGTQAPEALKSARSARCLRNHLQLSPSTEGKTEAQRGEATCPRSQPSFRSLPNSSPNTPPTCLLPKLQVHCLRQLFLVFFLPACVWCLIFDRCPGMYRDQTQK